MTPLNLERSGDYAAAAAAWEETAKTSTGRAAAQAWLNAGRLWVDSENRRFSTAKALAAFRKVETAELPSKEARETKSWISVLSQLSAARGATREAEREANRLESALEDVR